MAGTEIEAEKPQENGSEKPKLQGTVLMSGQLTADNGLREILEMITMSKDVQSGLLRVLSKDVRGYIGIFCGSAIVGAHVTSTREYGIQALRKLLTASKGMFVFMSLSELPIELRQSLTISIEDLLNWKPVGPQVGRPTLMEALSFFAARHADVIATNTEMSEALSSGLLTTDIGERDSDQEEEDDFLSYMAWGGEVPVLSSNLSKLTGQVLSKPDPSAPKAIIENILHTIQDAEGGNGLLQNSAPAAQQDFSVERLAPNPAMSPGPPPAQPEPRVAGRNGDDSGSSKWNLQDLESIPTPKAGDAPVPSTASGAMPRAATGPQPQLTGNQAKAAVPPVDPGIQQRKVLKDIDSAISGAGASEANMSSTQQPMKPLTQQDKDLNQLVTQRMQAVDPRSFINDGPRQVMSPEQRRKFEVMAIGGGIVGLGLFLALGQQVFNVTMAAHKYQTGVAAVKKGDNVLAQVDLTAAINLNGASPAYFYRAVAETRLGHIDKAWKDYNVLVGRQPKNVLAYAGRATLWMKAKKYQEAIEECNTILKINPEYLDGLRLRALAYCAAGQYKDAVDDATIYLARAAQDKKQTERARVETLSCRAFSYFKIKKFDEALQDYREAIGYNQKNSKLYSSRAIVYKQVKAWQKALADVQKAIELDPSDSTLYKLRGICYGGAGDAAKAAADLDRSVKLKPSVDSFFERGSARLAAKDYEGALEDFEYVLSINPNDKIAKAKFDLVRQALAGQVKPVPKFDFAENSRPTAPAPIKITGSASDMVKHGYDALKSGNPSVAISLLGAALKANPNDANARRYLAYAFAQKGDNANAAKQFGSLSSIQNLELDDRLAYGKALLATKQVENAVQIYSSILSAQPDNDAGRMGLINAYTQGGFTQRAAQLCQEGMSRNQASPRVVAAYQALLARTQGKK